MGFTPKPPTFSGLGDLQIGRITRFLQKWSGIKGKGLPSSLATEIQPIVTIFSGIENRYLDSWQRFFMSANLAASVGNRNAVNLRNPPGSKVIAVIEKIIWDVGIADFVTLSEQGLNSGAALDFGTVLTATGLDNRFGIPSAGIPGSVLVATSTQAAAPPTLGSQLWVGQYAANTQNDFILNEDQELPLLPGMAIRWNQGTANQGGSVSFLWRERALEDSELT